MWTYNNSLTAIFPVDALDQTGGFSEDHDFALVTYEGLDVWIVRERVAVSVRRSAL